MTRQNGIQFFEGKISVPEISSNTYIQGNLLPSVTQNPVESHGSSGPTQSLDKRSQGTKRKGETSYICPIMGKACAYMLAKESNCFRDHVEIKYTLNPVQ